MAVRPYGKRLAGVVSRSHKSIERCHGDAAVMNQETSTLLAGLPGFLLPEDDEMAHGLGQRHRII